MNFFGSSAPLPHNRESCACLTCTRFRIERNLTDIRQVIARADEANARVRAALTGAAPCEDADAIRLAGLGVRW